MTVTVDEEAMAEPRVCVRCSGQSLVAVVGRCADCIAQLGLSDETSEYEAWKSEVQAEFGRK